MRKVMIPLLGLATALCSGCASTLTTQLPEASSGRVGCAPEAITISNVRIVLNSVSWKSVCDGRIYYCSGTAHGAFDLRDVSCVPTQ